MAALRRVWWKLSAAYHVGGEVSAASSFIGSGNISGACSLRHTTNYLGTMLCVAEEVLNLGIARNHRCVSGQSHTHAANGLSPLRGTFLCSPPPQCQIIQHEKSWVDDAAGEVDEGKGRWVKWKIEVFEHCSPSFIFLLVRTQTSKTLLRRPLWKALQQTPDRKSVV